MVLKQLARGVTFVSKPIHPLYFPYPVAPTVHAARVSIAYQVNAHAAGSGGKLPWPTYIVGYLIMAWGGTLLTHQLLQIPPPMLYSSTPYAIYLGTHLTITLFFAFFASLLSPSSSSSLSFLAFLDSVIFPLDAIVRVSSITGTLVHLNPYSQGTTKINPNLVTSPVTHLIIGALASAGGSISASTLLTWTPNWTFSTPPVLRARSLASFWWVSMDVWGGAMVAGVYGVVTGHEAFRGVRRWVEGVIGCGMSGDMWGTVQGGCVDMGKPVWGDLEAKALCAGILGVCFGLRVYKTHWASMVKEKTAGKEKKGD